MNDRHVSPEVAAERREAERHECLAPARALQLAPRRQFNCVIKDISETGCRVVGVDVDTVHSPFLLKSGDWREPRVCDVRWRGRKTIGVRFSPTTSGDDPDAA